MASLPPAWGFQVRGRDARPPARAVLGAAWALALASPGPGHVPFVTVVKPGVPVRPITLFVNKASIESDRHGTLTWGAAQAGVAIGMTDAVAAGDIPADQADDLVAIAAVWVNPAADDAEAVFRNNAASTRNAVAAAGMRPAVRDGRARRPRGLPQPVLRPAAAALR